MPQITADMIIHDVVTRYPQTVKVFHGHGLPCTACHIGSRESIAGGAATHRLSLDALLEDLNKAVNGLPTSVEPKKVPVGRGIPLPVVGDTGGKIKHIIAIMSGKGGVGKSLVTGLLGVALRRQSLRVGILDGDITGPTIAKMFGTTGRPSKGQNGIDPLRSRSGIKIMSMNMFLPSETDPVVWRGPMVSSAIKQFYGDVDWGELDYLLVDLPPGTSDAPMTVMQSLPVEGVIIVSSPQMLATMIVMKCIGMVRTLKGRVIGIVENMVYFTPPGSNERYELFGPSKGRELVGLTGAPLLAQLPIDPTLAKLCDAGQIESYESEAYTTLAHNFINAMTIKKQPAMTP